MKILKNWKVMKIMSKNKKRIIELVNEITTIAEQMADDVQEGSFILMGVVVTPTIQKDENGFEYVVYDSGADFSSISDVMEYAHKLDDEDDDEN